MNILNTVSSIIRNLEEIGTTEKLSAVRAVWLSGRTEVHQLEGETRPEFETRSVLIFFSVVINCLHYTSSFRILGIAHSERNREQGAENKNFNLKYQKSCIVETVST